MVLFFQKRLLLNTRPESPEKHELININEQWKGAAETAKLSSHLSLKITLHVVEQKNNIGIYMVELQSLGQALFISDWRLRSPAVFPAKGQLGISPHQTAWQALGHDLNCE